MSMHQNNEFIFVESTSIVWCGFCYFETCSVLVFFCQSSNCGVAQRNQKPNREKKIKQKRIEHEHNKNKSKEYMSMNI